MVITPLGITVTIIGVKKSEIEGRTGTMWAKFPQGDYASPLRPTCPEEFEEQGYRRAHQGSHILRDKVCHWQPPAPVHAPGQQHHT